MATAARCGYRGADGGWRMADGGCEVRSGGCGDGQSGETTPQAPSEEMLQEQWDLSMVRRGLGPGRQ